MTIINYLIIIFIIIIIITLYFTTIHEGYYGVRRDSESSESYSMSESIKIDYYKNEPHFCKNNYIRPPELGITHPPTGSILEKQLRRLCTNRDQPEGPLEFGDETIAAVNQMVDFIKIPTIELLDYIASLTGLPENEILNNPIHKMKLFIEHFDDNNRTRLFNLVQKSLQLNNFYNNNNNCINDFRDLLSVINSIDDLSEESDLNTFSEIKEYINAQINSNSGSELPLYNNNIITQFLDNLEEECAYININEHEEGDLIMENNKNQLYFEAINIFLKFIINKNNNVIFGFTTPPMFILIDTVLKILSTYIPEMGGIMLSTNQIYSSLLNEMNRVPLKSSALGIRETISHYEENLIQNGTFIYTVFNVIKNYERIEPTSALSDQISSIKDLITPSGSLTIFDFDNLISISTNGDFTFDEYYINYITFIKVHLLDLHILKMINNFDYSTYSNSVGEVVSVGQGEDSGSMVASMVALIGEDEFTRLKSTLLSDGITYFQRLYDNPDEIDNILFESRVELDSIWERAGMKTNIKYLDGNETTSFYEIFLIFHYFQNEEYKRQYIQKFNDLEDLSKNLDNIIINNKLTDLNDMDVRSYDSYQNSPSRIQDKVNEIMNFKGSLHISRLSNEKILELNERYYHLQSERSEVYLYNRINIVGKSISQSNSISQDGTPVQGIRRSKMSKEGSYRRRNPVINSRLIELNLPNSVNDLLCSFSSNGNQGDNGEYNDCSSDGFRVSLNEIITILAIINLLFGVDENECAYLSGPRNLLCFNIQVILRHLLQTIKNINIGKLFNGINAYTDEYIQLIGEVRDEYVSIFEDFLNVLCNTSFSEDGKIQPRNNKTLNRANCGVCNVRHIYDNNDFFNDNSDESCNQCNNIPYPTCRGVPPATHSSSDQQRFGMIMFQPDGTPYPTRN